jgi:hypothetical protein
MDTRARRERERHRDAAVAAASQGLSGRHAETPVPNQRGDAIAQRRLQTTLAESPRTRQGMQWQHMADRFVSGHQMPGQAQATGPAIQLKKIIRFGQTIDVPDDHELQPGEQDVETGVRRRIVANRPPQPMAPDEAAPDAPRRPTAHFETIHGSTAHGPVSWASTGLSVITGMPDVNAAINSGADLMHSARQTRREFGRGEYKNAAISAGQTILSGVQAATASPLSHMAGHAAALTLGSPVPLPIGDALWYPANWGKSGLENYRDPKKKTD